MKFSIPIPFSATDPLTPSPPSIEEDIANIERTLTRTMELLAERGYNVLNNPMPTMALIAAGACFSPYVLGGILITDLLLHHRDLWQSSKEAVAHFWAFCIEMALLHKAATTLQAAGQQAINAAMPRIRTMLNELASLARHERGSSRDLQSTRSPY